MKAVRRVRPIAAPLRALRPRLNLDGCSRPPATLTCPQVSDVVKAAGPRFLPEERLLSGKPLKDPHQSSAHCLFSLKLTHTLKHTFTNTHTPLSLSMP